MNTGLERTWFKFALVALLAVGGLTDAALAQELDASRAALTGSHETQTNTFSARNAKAVPSVGKFRAAEATPAPEIVKLPSSHQAVGARVELIHLPTFSAAGLIEKGSKSIRLMGVVATAIDAQCGSGPDAWPCGRMARAALQRFVRRRSVECRMPVTDRLADGMAHCTRRRQGHRRMARCTRMGQGQWTRLRGRREDRPGREAGRMEPGSPFVCSRTGVRGSDPRPTMPPYAPKSIFRPRA